MAEVKIKFFCEANNHSQEDMEEEVNKFLKEKRRKFINLKMTETVIAHTSYTTLCLIYEE